jgi:cytoskeletal protein RodZ
MTEEIKDFQLDDTATMTAGGILHAARTTGRRKREIQTIAKQLCIREEFLQALEEGNYNVLPETVYILGFARNYAIELGLDPDMIVDKIKQEMGILQPDDVTPNAHDIALKESEKVAFGQRIQSIKKAGVVKFVVKHWKWFVGGLLVFVLLIVGLLMILPSENVAPVVEEQPVQVAAAVVSIDPEYKLPVREKFGTENRDSARIILQAVKESWVKIEDARGKTVFSRVLVPGDIYYVPDGNKNKATFGNAGGIDIWVDKVLVSKAGADNTRKSGIALDADALSGVKKTTN